MSIALRGHSQRVKLGPTSSQGREAGCPGMDPPARGGEGPGMDPPAPGEGRGVQGFISGFLASLGNGGI